jgi:DNA-binding transcriptional LysR family regulator
MSSSSSGEWPVTVSVTVSVIGLVSRLRSGLEGTAHAAFAVRDWPSRLGLVAAGLGVAVVPQIMREALPPDVALVAVNARTATLRDVTRAETRADPSPAAAALLEALQAEGTKISSA